MKKILVSALMLTNLMNSIPVNASYETSIDWSLWDKFIKYDLCITDYDSLTDEEKDLCKFIFETEQSTNETIICERARRTLAHDENIGDRLTLDELENCYGVWDNYSDSKVGRSWYIHCVPDIKYLDGWDDYNEYWLDDTGNVKVISTGENSNLDNSATFEVKISNETDLSKYDIPEDAEINQNSDGTYDLSYNIEKICPRPYYSYEGNNNLVITDDFINVDGDYYFVCPDNTVTFVKSKYSQRTMNDTQEPIEDAVIIPDEINGLPVTTIEATAFMYAPVTEVVLPDTIEFINSQAFESCIYLEKVNFPQSIKYIGRYAFAYCAFESLDIDLPNVSISPNTFESCSKLTDLSINAKSIGDKAFSDCTNLKNVVLDSVQKIDSKAFMDCSTIENIQLPNSLKSIGAGAFTGVKTIEIPPNVQIIGALPRQHGIGATSGIEVLASHPLTDEQECVFDSDCTINGYYNTEAHYYAIVNNLKFNPLDENVAYGDTNTDGKITVADAVTLQHYVVGSVELNNDNWINSDLTKDGIVNVFDLIALKKKLAYK